MKISETLLIGTTVTELYDLIADLGNYPDWLGLVVRADPEDPPTLDPRGSWIIELRGQVGPFARSKRLRMVRTVADRPRTLCFERIETDGRDHSPWELTAHLDRADAGVELTMELDYGGNRFAPVLAPILREEIRNGRRLLQERFPLPR